MKTYIIKDKRVLFDDDFDLKQEDYTWDITAKNYVRFKLKGQKKGTSYVRVHRYILGLKPNDGKISDHINRNPLDNQRKNLRVVSHLESLMNRSITQSEVAKHPRGKRDGASMSKKSTSQLGKYIYPNHNSKTYFVAIYTKNKVYHGGSFSTLEEASAKALELDKDTKEEKGYLGIPLT